MLKNKRIEREKVAQQIKKEREIQKNNQRLLKEFDYTLKTFNGYKNKPQFRTIYGYKLFRIYNLLNKNLQEKIKEEKGNHLILLIKKEHNNFVTLEKEDAEKYKLKSDPIEIQMIALLKEEKGVLFKDKLNNLYRGDFFNLGSIKYAQEYVHIHDDLQMIDQSIYLGTDSDPDDSYTYYQEFDILIDDSVSYYHISDDERYGIDGKDYYGSNNVRSDYYKIIYNVSRKVSLFNKNERNNKYNETMLYLYKEGFNFELAEKEQRYIDDCLKEEKIEKEKEEQERIRIEKLKAIKYDGAIMEDYFQRDESGGVCYIDDSIYKVGDIVVDNKGNVLIVCSRTTIDGLFAEQYKDQLGKVVRFASKEDIKNAKNKK